FLPPTESYHSSSTCPSVTPSSKSSFPPVILFVVGCFRLKTTTSPGSVGLLSTPAATPLSERELIVSCWVPCVTCRGGPPLTVANHRLSLPRSSASKQAPPLSRAQIRPPEPKPPGERSKSSARRRLLLPSTFIKYSFDTV